jgi:uncharacterized metal-binding protein
MVERVLKYCNGKPGYEDIVEACEGVQEKKIYVRFVLAEILRDMAERSIFESLSSVFSVLSVANKKFSVCSVSSVAKDGNCVF